MIFAPFSFIFAMNIYPIPLPLVSFRGGGIIPNETYTSSSARDTKFFFFFFSIVFYAFLYLILRGVFRTPVLFYPVLIFFFLFRFFFFFFFGDSMTF